jgi:hypothetical protein
MLSGGGLMALDGGTATWWSFVFVIVGAGVFVSGLTGLAYPTRDVIVDDDAITTPAPFGRSETIRYGEIAQLGEQDVAGDRFFTMTGSGKRAWIARSRLGDATYEEIVALVHERCGLPRQTIAPLPEARAID